MDLIRTYETIANYLQKPVLKTVQRDHDLIANGHQLLFAVDHYEVSSFCYPVVPEKIYKDEEIKEIVKQQNAYYDLFYRLSSKPVLLLPYVEELYGLVNFVNSSRFAYSEKKISEYLFRELDINEERLKSFHRSQQSISGETEIGYERILAYLLACASIGPRRLDDLFTRRLEKNRLPRGAEDLVNLDQLQPGEIYEYVKRAPQLGERRRLAAERDARAIDAVFQVNAVLVPHRKLLLYVSSTDHAKQLFASEEIRRRMPRIDGEIISVHRTYEHFWTHMVFREDKGDPIDSAKETAMNIGYALDIIDSAGDIIDSLRSRKREDECQGCRLESDCKHHDTCRKIFDLGQRISERQSIFGEWGGLKGLRDLSNFLSKNRETLCNKSQARPLLALIRNHIDQWETSMVVDLNRTVRHAIVDSSLARNLGDLNQRVPISMSDDQVTCRFQHLPVFLNLRESRAKAIFKEFRTHIYGDEDWDSNRFDVVNRAFMKITVAALADNLGPEDQLLAGALYTVWTDEDGLHSARNIAYLVYNAGDVPLATRQEALYLLVWTNRQLNYLSESMELAQEGIEKYPDDPRFHHGLQLALHLQCRRNMEYPAKIIKQIVQHGDEAIRLYGTIDNREGQATCANNNAYILAARSELKSAVQEARRYLAILNGALPEATWGRRLPEFYDTKAAVLYRYSRYLAERAWKRGGDLAAAIAEAEEAYAAADAAYQLVEKSRYEERRALIKVYLDRLRNGTLL